MITFLRHVPSFVEVDEGFPRGYHHFPSVEALLADPWVTGWSHGGDFHRWSQSDGHLIVELDGGDKQYVVGYIASPTPIALPQWLESPVARARREAWNRGEIP